MKLISILILAALGTSAAFSQEVSVQITSLKGDVKVRYGLEEKWHSAETRMLLKDLDTIMSGKNGEVIVKTNDGRTFKLGANAIIDVVDLKKVQQDELFLYLMSKKVDKIAPLNNKEPLRVGNVSVVHGSLGQMPDSNVVDSTHTTWYLFEKNGALALLLQEFYTNSIIKLHKIIDKYGNRINEGEIYFYIAKGFEAINNSGQAIDAYKKSMAYYQKMDSKVAKQKANEISLRIKKLKK